MVIFQNSLGRWVYHDGSSYQYFDTEQEARMAGQMQTIGETPAEYEIAATVTQSLLPQLREALLALTALKMAWYANDIPGMIAAAKAPPTEKTGDSSATLLAGLPPQAWEAWGAVFASLETWLNTPLEGMNTTPMAILVKRYVTQA